MPDRHSELVRQRALVLEHLAWLDREIASAAAGPVNPSDASLPTAPPTAPAPAAPSETGQAVASPAAFAPTAKLPDEIPPEAQVVLEQYRVEPAALKQDIRKGCLLYFVGAFVLLGIVVAILYFAIGSR
jgi:hypothetical protein